MQLYRPYPLLACVWVSKLVASAALPEPVTDLAPLSPSAAALEKREENGPYCWKFKYEGGNAVFFRLMTWGPWDQDWGQGLLDNLRGKCWAGGGTLYSWSFGYEQGTPPTNGWATFDFGGPGPWDNHCVEDAVWAASNGAGQAIWNMNCNPSNLW